jgi:hypothetical protein
MALNATLCGLALFGAILALLRAACLVRLQSMTPLQPPFAGATDAATRGSRTPAWTWPDTPSRLTLTRRTALPIRAAGWLTLAVAGATARPAIADDQPFTIGSPYLSLESL